MDISSSAAPKSDQQNFDDYIAGPRTVTVTEVTKDGEGRLSLHLAEYPGRPYKPAKSMIRVLIAAWGSDGAQYAGRRLTLYGDGTVKFGGQAVGGIRISHLSHIDKQLTVSLTVTRGKRAPFTVQPLEDAPPAPDKTTAALTAIRNATDHKALDKIAAHAASLGIDVTGAIEARKLELT